jgi:DnaK suppressor protein
MTLTQQRLGRAATRQAPRPEAPGGASWRALLEARWRERLHELTELCVAFHEAGAEGPASQRQPSLRQLMRRAVHARQALAETDAALRRLAIGIFGRCEDCSAPIPESKLLSSPEARYCPACAA